MKNIIIRHANLDDWKIIQKLNYEVFKDNLRYDKFQDMSWPYSKRGEEYYQKVTKNPKNFCIIAFVDNNPVGYLVGGNSSFDYRSVKTAEIHNMGVSSRFRSQGIGEKLIQNFFKWVKIKGFQSVYVSPYAQNTRAIKFYEKSGFELWSLGMIANL